MLHHHTSTRQADRSHRARFLAAALGVALSAAAVTALPGTASASVSSGNGQSAYTITQCQTAITHNHSFDASARVFQEFDGQYVAARFWVYDSDGYWKSSNWTVKNDPGWQYDGSVSFEGAFNDLSGTWAYLYVQYAWYDANGWRSGGEMIRDYTDIYAQHSSYCEI